MRTIAAALTARYGLESAQVTPLPGGFIHRVWRADTNSGLRVVKLYRGDDWTPARVAPTLAVQAHAAAAGHPVPSVHRTRAGELLAPAEGGWLAVFDLAPGSHIGETELTAPAAAGAGIALARLHRTLAALPGVGVSLTAGGMALPVGETAQMAVERERPLIPTMEAVRERALRVLENARASVAPDALDELAMAAASFRLAALEQYPIDPDLYAGEVYQVVHGDYYPGNLLFDDDGDVSAILDWDFCGVNWRGLEVGRAAVEAGLRADGGLDRERMLAFLRAYDAELPVSAVQRLAMFRLWFNYLLFSLYPLSLRYQPGASLPQGWEQLAWRRHRLLLLLGKHLADLEEWAVGL